MGRTALIGINNRILFGVVLIIVSMGLLLVFGSGYVMGTVEKVMGFMGWEATGEVQVDGYTIDREATSGQFRLQFHYVNSADSEKTVHFEIKGEEVLGTIPADAPSSGITVKGGSATPTQGFIYGDDSGENIDDIACEIEIVVKSDKVASVNRYGYASERVDTVEYKTLTTKRIDLEPFEGPGGTRCR